MKRHKRLRNGLAIAVIIPMVVMASSCGAGDTSDSDAREGIVFEHVDADEETSVSEESEDSQNHYVEAGADSGDMDVLEIDDSDAMAYLSGGWYSWSMVGDTEKGAVPRSYYVFDTGKVYEYSTVSLATGEYTTCTVQDIYSIERSGDQYRIRIKYNSREGGYTLQTLEQDPDILCYYMTWDENEFSSNYSGSGSLERASKSETKGYVGKVGEIVAGYDEIVSFTEPASSALVDDPACGAAYAEIVEEAKKQGQMDGYYVVDISGDKVPELLIYEGRAHAGKVRIYTYADGKTVDLGRYGEWGQTRIDTENHSICDSFFGMGSLAETYYDVIGDQVILRGYAGQYERFNEETGDPYYTYDVDHEAVTEEEYENAVNQYSTGKYTEYGYHTYQMYGIETYAVH